MNPTDVSMKARFRVGIFAILGLILVGGVSLWVNHKPFWWRPCQLVRISVDDATGLKKKSPIRSLGLEIGYLSTVELSETHVTLGICVTAPVQVLPTTRAYIRGEGFLGDKFVELKPVRYLGGGAAPAEDSATTIPPEPTAAPVAPTSQHKSVREVPFGGEIARVIDSILDFAIPTANAADAAAAPPQKGREIPVGAESQDMQQLVGRVDQLVKEMTSLTTNLKKSINPEELHATMRQLNHALENASNTLSPQGGLNQTAQRTLSKLEDAVEQMRDQLTRINQGQGSVGKLLNDPTYADEIHDVIKNANKLLTKVADVRFVVDIGAEQITAYNGSRGWFKLQIFPTPTYYYLLGAAVDPRGKRTAETDTTIVGGQTTVVQVTKIEQTGLLFTAMIGKIFNRYLEGAVGALNGDGAATIRLRLGPPGMEDRLVIQNDIYSHSGDNSLNDRVGLIVFPMPILYVRAGLEAANPYNGQTPYFFGAGLRFDDESIKLLFALR